jgi:hypothetical protein
MSYFTVFVDVNFEVIFHVRYATAPEPITANNSSEPSTNHSDPGKVVSEPDEDGGTDEESTTDTCDCAGESRGAKPKEERNCEKSDEGESAGEGSSDNDDVSGGETFGRGFEPL